MTNDTYHLVGSNGDIILFDDIQYVVLRDTLAGLSGIPVEYDVSYSPGLIGGDVHSASIIEREISLHVAILGDSRNEIEQRRTRLITALNPANGESKFYWKKNNGAIFYLRVRPQSTYPSFDVGTNANPRVWECTIDLVSYDPCWYSDTVITREFVRLQAGFKLPLKFPFTFGNRMPTNTITNNGSLPAPIEIVLHGRIRSPIILTNNTTGKTLTIRRDVAEGETLTINTSPDNTSVTVTDSQGNVSNALYYCTIGSQFWQLASGANSISANFTQVYSTASGTIAYRERYIGL